MERFESSTSHLRISHLQNKLQVADSFVQAIVQTNHFLFPFLESPVPTLASLANSMSGNVPGNYSGQTNFMGTKQKVYEV